jgi:hypothetical protein
MCGGESRFEERGGVQIFSFVWNAIFVMDSFRIIAMKYDPIPVRTKAVGHRDL